MTMEISMNLRMQALVPSLVQRSGWLAVLLLTAAVYYFYANGAGVWSNFGIQSANAESGAKSVAWYVANLHEAREVNRACYGPETPRSPTEAEDCRNSLQALKMSHVGQNYQN